MKVREITKTIERHVGGSFTGKVAVRIIDGEIVACDVGAAGTGMPHLTHTEAMKRVVNPPPEPPEKPPHVREAEAEAQRAQLEYDRATDVWFEALDNHRTIERQVAAQWERNNSSGPVDSSGRPSSEELHQARAAQRSAEKEMERTAEVLRSARVKATDVTRKWEREQRLAEMQEAG